MLIVIAKSLPDAVRGRMKLWFIEPRPNVFISGMQNAVAEKVIALLYSYCDADADLLIIKDITSSPGIAWSILGNNENVIRISGLDLISRNKEEKQEP